MPRGRGKDPTRQRKKRETMRASRGTRSAPGRPVASAPRSPSLRKRADRAPVPEQRALLARFLGRHNRSPAAGRTRNWDGPSPIDSPRRDLLPPPPPRPCLSAARGAPDAAPPARSRGPFVTREGCRRLTRAPQAAASRPSSSGARLCRRREINEAEPRPGGDCGPQLPLCPRAFPPRAALLSRPGQSIPGLWGGRPASGRRTSGARAR